MNTIKESFETATGPIEYTLMNDFMFRAILQRNKQVLIALICALLHLPTEGVDAEITNPIELGAAFSNKDFILDIRVKLSNGRLIDLEMQIAKEPSHENSLARSDGVGDMPSAYLMGRSVPSAMQRAVLTT